MVFHAIETESCLRGDQVWAIEAARAAVNAGTGDLHAYGDGRLLFDTGFVTWQTLPKPVLVDIAAIQVLDLLVTVTVTVTVTDAGNGNDHADWTGTTITCKPDRRGVAPDGYRAGMSRAGMSSDRAVRRRALLLAAVGVVVAVGVLAVVVVVLADRGGGGGGGRPPGRWVVDQPLYGRVALVVTGPDRAYLLQADGNDPTQWNSVQTWDGHGWTHYGSQTAEFTAAQDAVEAGNATGTGQPDQHGLIRSGPETYRVHGRNPLSRRVGGRWEAVALPRGTDRSSFTEGSPPPAACGDGHGGVWLAGDEYLHWHDGRWDRYPLLLASAGQRELFRVGYLVLVPGSRTLLAVVSSLGEEEGQPDQIQIERYVP
jgi:hypothetical protein